AVGAEGAPAEWSGFDGAATRAAGRVPGTGPPPGAPGAVVPPRGGGVQRGFVAAERAGLTVVGLGHRAGDNEIRHLVSLTRADALVTLAEHRGRPTSELVEMLRAAGCTLHHHVVVDTDGWAADRDAPTGDLAGRAYGPDDLF